MMDNEEWWQTWTDSIIRVLRKWYPMNVISCLKVLQRKNLLQNMEISMYGQLAALLNLHSLKISQNARQNGEEEMLEV